MITPFSQAVAEFLALDPIVNERAMTRRFGCWAMTVHRWATGVAVPGACAQKSILDYIKEHS